MSTAVVTAVQENACDIGLIVEGPKVSGLEVIPYRDNRLVLTVPENHPLAGRSSVKFADTLDYDYVGLHTGSQINLQIQRAAAELDKAWRCRMQVHTYDALAAMVQAGLGIGMLPLKMAHLYAKAMNVKVVELDETWAQRRHAIVIRSYDSQQTAGKRLIDHLKRTSQPADARAEEPVQQVPHDPARPAFRTPVIVTCAATGIGQAFALGCAAQGANVVAADMNDAEKRWPDRRGLGARRSRSRWSVDERRRAMAQAR